jgi:hypothetical protein
VWVVVIVFKPVHMVAGILTILLELQINVRFSTIGYIKVLLLLVFKPVQEKPEYMVT